MYGSLAIVGFVAGCTFFLCFRKGRKWTSDAVVLEAVAVASHSVDCSGQVDKAGLSTGV